MSLQKQLTLVALLPLLLFSLLVTLVSAYALRQVSLNLALQRNTALVQVAAAGVAEELRGYLYPLQAAADTLVAADSIAAQAAKLNELAGFLNRFEGGVALLDSRGVAVAATPGHEERLGLDYSFRAYFKTIQGTRQPVFSAVLQEVPSGRNAVVVAVPVLHSERLVGVLIGVRFLGADSWRQDLEPLRTRQGGQVYMVDATGTIIYHPDPTRLGTALPADATLRPLLDTRQPQSLLCDSLDLGQPAITSLAPLPGVGCTLIMEEPWRALLAPTLPFQWAAAGILMVGIALFLYFLLKNLRRVTQPLMQLVQEAEAIPTQSPFQPLKTQGPLEIQVLINAFNQMVLRLDEQQVTLRQYALQVLQSQEEERRRVARDLHDETVQDLVGLVQRIELCRYALDRDPEAAKRRLDELHTLVASLVSDVRRLSHNLRPLALEDLGLTASLQMLCRELRRDMPAARVHCEIVGSEHRLTPELELTVFRTVQEALNNVRKHARTATQVTVTLFYEEWGILTTVEDNGPGFEVPELAVLVREGHLGVAGMSERARLFAGELTLASAPGAGTTVTLRLPAPHAGTNST